MGTALPRKQVKGTLPFPRWYIATRLAELREARGTSPEAAAKAVDRAPSTVYDAESGKTVPQRATLQSLLRLYRADQATTSLLLDLRREPDSHEWWEPFSGDLPGDYGLYISCERRAASIHNYEAIAIPGLLQTRAYAQALVAGQLPELAAGEVARRVDVRVQRQSILTADEPVKFHAIVDEAALNKAIGGWGVMRSQLAGLLDLPPTVTLQVIRNEVGAYPEIGWPFGVVQLRDPRAPTLVFAERSAGHSVVDGDEDLRRYADKWERLTSVAMDPMETRALIAAKLK